MDLYQQFISKKNYSRYLPEKNRREHWPETVDRYLRFMQQKLMGDHGHEIPNVEELRNAIVNLEVMPSMRALMTAGPALERDNVAGYNCAYMPVDDIRSFDEAMYILMCGTGVGFSVEEKYTSKLPEVPESLKQASWTHIVEDSKEGWASSLCFLIKCLYEGMVVNYDLSKVRPAGSRLKTFGGRASGPGPLDSLFKFVIHVFKNAQGRKLAPLECHDIMCKVGEVVVSGGVRRSAMISLSDLDSSDMRHCKSGSWWEVNPQRSLANNSAVYDRKPSVGQFMEEWLSLYNSHSGERGIFNRDASRRQVAKNGRRDENHDWGTNPCSEIILRPYQFCNLTEVVVREKDNILDLERKVRIASQLGTYQSTLTYFPYLRPIWKENTEAERLLGVSLTGILDNRHMGSKWETVPYTLKDMRNVAVETNKYFSRVLEIQQSAAITCVKPSGTVSQLVDSASGIHARHSEYYIRRVRSDKKDPLTKFLIEKGVPAEDCVMRPETTTIFSFPIKSPEGSKKRDDMTATEHLDLWMMYQRYWCEHKPSVTISVKENEWPEVAAWVWENFDEVSGVSFLPYDGGTYQQAPYEECAKDVYEELLSRMPTEINWDELNELEDNVDGIQELACTAGGCEVR